MPLQRPSSTSSALAIVSSENGQPPPSPPPPHPTDGCHLSIKGWKPFMSVKFYVFCQGLVEFSMIMYFAYYKAIISQVSGRTNVETDSTPIKGQSICLLDVQGGCWHARQRLTEASLDFSWQIQWSGEPLERTGYQDIPAYNVCNLLSQTIFFIYKSYSYKSYSCQSLEMHFCGAQLYWDCDKKFDKRGPSSRI